jgi:hypothetical protein
VEDEEVGWAWVLSKPPCSLAKQRLVGKQEAWVDVLCSTPSCQVCMAREPAYSLPLLLFSVLLLFLAVFALLIQQAQAAALSKQTPSNRCCSPVSWAAEQIVRDLSTTIVALTGVRGPPLHGDLYPVLFQPILSTPS